jgi:hypothetical protein
MRNVNYLASQALEHGEHVGAFAKVLLEDKFPWTKMRRVYKLLTLAKKYSSERVNNVCGIALESEMHDIRRLERMLVQSSSFEKPLARVIPIGRYLRPINQYALPITFREADKPQGEK